LCTLLKWTANVFSYIIYKVVQPSMLCNSRILSLSKETSYPWSMATIDVPSVHMDLIVTTFFSYKWNNAVCALYVWTLSCGIFFIHPALWISTSFFFMDELHSLMWVKYILIIHLSVCGHLGCFYLLIIIKGLLWTSVYKLLHGNSYQCYLVCISL
jgi:hypothetical protein